MTLGRTALVASCFAIAACNPSPARNGIASEGPSASTSPHTISSTDGSSAPPASVGRGRVKVVEATQDLDALSLIRTRRLEAKADGRVLVVYVGAKWCEPCKRFKAEVSSGRLDERLRKVTLLTFDVDEDGERLGAAGYAFTFVPFVARPGADGRPADTQQAGGKGGEAWRELLGKLDVWQSDI